MAHTLRGLESDATLVSRSLEGNQAAWSALVERYGRLVYSIPKGCRLPDDACEDVFQEVFVALLRHLDSIRDPSALAKWLMTAAHRETWRWARANKRNGHFDAAVPEPQPPSDPLPEFLIRREREHKLHMALEQLGGRCEELLRAIFLDPSDPSYAAIAARLSIPVGSIGPTRIRCLAKLSELVQDLE